MTNYDSKTKEELLREVKRLQERLDCVERDAVLQGSAYELGERFKGVFLNMLDAVLVVDGDSGRILDANPAATRILGFTRDQLVDHHFSILFWADNGRTPDDLWEQVQVYGTVLEAQEFRRADNTACPMSLAASIIPWGASRKAVLLTLRDISERHAAEERLREYREKLQGLAEELAETEDRERRRYARELHDRIGQSLAIVKIRVGLLHDLLPSEHARHVDELATLLDPIIQDVRSLTFELSPPVLDELGLEPALDWLADNFCRTHGLAVTLEADATGELAHDVASLLFQAVRELLMNTLKHAQATEALITLNASPGNDVEVTVQDNGKGIEPDRLASRASGGGFGLFSISERLHRYGGHFEIAPHETGGTRARLVVPTSRAWQAG